MRQVHLDFHTSPDIPDVGVDWDADHFVETLQRAHVNSVTIFATCHHGMSYYPSKVAPVHPSLKFDLLGEQIEALHRVGIRCPIYLTVGWNVSAAERHPEWRQVDIHGKNVGGYPFEPSWPWMCVGTDYTEELIAQTEELLANYDVDGFFYDILMYHPDGCVNMPSLKSMAKLGLNPKDAGDRKQHNHILARRFMERTTNVIRAKLPEAGIFYNSRWGLHFIDEAEYYSQVEIESLPTGGWGYAFYPFWSRYGRSFGKPMLGMTGRFHKMWADWGGLKHPDALKFECGGILATGGAVSIGDQLHPRGRLNEAVYDVIGQAFDAVEQIEEFCINATPVSQIGLLILDPEADKANQTSAGIKTSPTEGAEGASKMLLELHHQFDVITDRSCDDFTKYDLLILPDVAVGSPEVVTRLKSYVAGGGKLLISHEAMIRELSEEAGVTVVGHAESNPDYFTIDDARLFGPVTRAGFPYSIYEGPTLKVKAGPDTLTLCQAHETYFNRTAEHFSSHGFTPPKSDKPDYPAATLHKGVLYFYGPIFRAYNTHGNLTFRHLIGEMIRLLIEPILVTSAPPTAEVTMMRQEEGERTLVHIVNYSAQRRSTKHVEALEIPVPLHQVTLQLAGFEGELKATIARNGHALPIRNLINGIMITVPFVSTHEVIVIEKGVTSDVSNEPSSPERTLYNRERQPVLK